MKYTDLKYTEEQLLQLLKARNQLLIIEKNCNQIIVYQFLQLIGISIFNNQPCFHGSVHSLPSASNNIEASP